MATDHIRYDILAQNALRGVMREVLTDAAKNGLPGEHHFYISFDTNAEGVRMSDRLREQHPQDMTIILQHQFWDLAVTADHFEVGLSFNGVPEKLVIPFDAVKGFFDPSVQFGLQFETIDADAAAKADEKSEPKSTTKSASKSGPKAVAKNETDALPAPANPDNAPKGAARDATWSAEKSAETASDKPDSEKMGEVVRLDRFRKK